MDTQDVYACEQNSFYSILLLPLQQRRIDATIAATLPIAMPQLRRHIVPTCKCSSSERGVHLQDSSLVGEEFQLV
jgi:hypothetical protein